MPPHDSERLADRMLGAFRPWLVQLLEAMPPDSEQTDDGLTAADHERIDRSLIKLRERKRSTTHQRKEPPPRNAKRPTGKVERSKGQET